MPLQETVGLDELDEIRTNHRPKDCIFFGPLCCTPEGKDLLSFFFTAPPHPRRAREGIENRLLRLGPLGEDGFKPFPPIFFTFHRERNNMAYLFPLFLSSTP